MGVQIRGRGKTVGGGPGIVLKVVFRVFQKRVFMQIG